MRVNIEHSTKTTGLLRKTTHYVVTLTVEFTDEEKHIIRERRLGKDVIMERDIPSDKDPAKFAKVADAFHIRIQDLLRGPDSYALSTPLEAKAYEAELTEKVTLLKSYIDGNRSVEQQSTTFEL